MDGMDGMDAAEDAVLGAGRLLTALQARVRVAGTELTPRASIGGAGWAGHAGHAEIDELRHDADTAMYAAKTAGKGRVASTGEAGAVRLYAPPHVEVSAT